MITPNPKNRHSIVMIKLFHVVGLGIHVQDAANLENVITYDRSAAIYPPRAVQDVQVRESYTGGKPTMTSPKFAITPASAAIALKYGKTVSRGIAEMEKHITRKDVPVAGVKK